LKEIIFLIGLCSKCVLWISFILKHFFLGTHLCPETRNVQQQNMPNEVEYCKLYVKLNNIILEQINYDKMESFYVVII